MASTQQSLFDTQPPPWELDDAATALVATVVLAGGPVGEFDYLVPAEMVGRRAPERKLEAGRRVRVPLGRSNRSVVGYCVEVAMKPTGGRKLKSVAAVLDRRPLLSAPDVAAYAMDGRLLLVSLGPGAGGSRAGGCSPRCGRPRCDAPRRSRRMRPNGAATEAFGQASRSASVLTASERPLTAKELAARAGCTFAPINVLRKKGLMSGERRATARSERKKRSIRGKRRTN